MIYTELNEKDIALYHVKNWERRTETDEYKELRESIKEHGILDPVLVEDFPEGLRIEIGEQRLLIARELGIETLKAFVRPKKMPEVIHAEGERITSPEQARTKFRNEQVPCWRALKQYMEA